MGGKKRVDRYTIQQTLKFASPVARVKANPAAKNLLLSHSLTYTSESIMIFKPSYFARAHYEYVDFLSSLFLPCLFLIAQFIFALLVSNNVHTLTLTHTHTHSSLTHLLAILITRAATRTLPGGIDYVPLVYTSNFTGKKGTLERSFKSD